jgi:hydroxymethylglutaryl-CoA lyase
VALPLSLTIRDVGPRDGLQAEAPVPVTDRIRLVEALVVAGVRNIEVCSFVSPKAVPAMADGGSVLAAIAPRTGLTRAALVPNVRGAQMALASGVDELTVTVSASEVYSQKNVTMTVEEALISCAHIVATAHDHGQASSSEPVPVDVIVSCSFGSPYEGEIAPDAVAAIAERLLSDGAMRITFADTTGMATPRTIEELWISLSSRARADAGLHLHETRGTGLLNAYAGMQLGITRFDTSVGGLGGSPFAAGAAGNLATEDLVHLCDDLGIATGIDLHLLLEAAELTAAIVGHSVPSKLLHAGPRTSVGAALGGANNALV